MSAKNVRFLDFNAGSPLVQNLDTKILEWFQASGKTSGGRIILGNPSSISNPGVRARRALQDAEDSVRKSLGCMNIGTWIWTSCGTEAIQTFIRSAVKPGTTWWLGNADHSAARDIVPFTVANGATAKWIPLRTDGSPNFSEFLETVDSKTSLISILWANNETGVIISDFELRNVIETLRKKAPNAFVLVDACQCWGKIDIDLTQWDFDAVAFAGAKIGALPGTGGLWVKDASRFQALLYGKQQGGMRSGTEGVMGILSVGWAAEKVNAGAFQAHTRVLQQKFESYLKEQIPVATIAGDGALRASNTTRIVLKVPKVNSWVSLLDVKGFAVSSGSACASRLATASHVLLAMGISEHDAKNSLRVSYGTDTTEQDLIDFVDALRDIWKKTIEHEGN